MQRSLRHVLAASLALALVSCSSWGPPLPRSRLTADKGPSRARVTLADGRQFEVQHPKVLRDTLFGDTLSLRNLDRMAHVQVSIPVDRVRSVSASQFSAGKTMLLVLAVPTSVYVGCVVGGCFRIKFGY